MSGLLLLFGCPCYKDNRAGLDLRQVSDLEAEYKFKSSTEQFSPQGSTWKILHWNTTKLP